MTVATSKSPSAVSTPSPGMCRAIPRGVFDPLALAQVFRTGDALLGVVAHGHPFAAARTDDESLKQCRAFAWRTLATLFAAGLRTLGQLGEVLLVLLPRDVSGVGIGDQRDPRLAGLEVVAHPAIGMVSLSTSPIGKRAGVTWIVQHLEHTVVLE